MAARFIQVPTNPKDEFSMKKVNRAHKLSRREALIGLTGFAAATPVLAAPGSSELPKHPAAVGNKITAPRLIAHGRDLPFDPDWRFHRGDVSGAENPNFDEDRKSVV